MKTLIQEFSSDMNPIEQAGVVMIGILAVTFLLTFATFAVAVITGDANLANATFGIADISI